VYVLGDHSTDNTGGRGRGVIDVEPFPADGVADDTTRPLRWERILKREAELARVPDADWFIHRYSDEFREAGRAMRFRQRTKLQAAAPKVNIKSTSRPPRWRSFRSKANAPFQVVGSSVVRGDTPVDPFGITLYTSGRRPGA